MPGPILCECGEVLVEEIDEQGVRPVGSEEFIAFRRTTDYVVCPRCARSYSVRALAPTGDDVGKGSDAGHGERPEVPGAPSITDRTDEPPVTENP